MKRFGYSLVFVLLVVAVLAGCGGTPTSNRSDRLVWKFKTGGEIESTPAVSGGVVYFGSDDHYLYAVR